MRVLILGATGLLGQACVRQARAIGADVVGAARSGSELDMDVTRPGSLDNALDAAAPDLVVNCAGLTDLDLCERDPGLAYAVNARPAGILAALGDSRGFRFVHISTDHFFVAGGRTAHKEDSPVTLVNEYARTKYCGERLALLSPQALVIRTSMLGFRRRGAATLAEWAIAAIERDEPMTLFADAFTSSIDTDSLAAAIFDLDQRGAVGLVNVGSSAVYSKAEFVRRLADAMGKRLSHATTGSAAGLRPRRADSLGLDVTRAEAILERPLPGLNKVVESLLRSR
jgi:dTDP-4-dehydrorhamnose reductase